MHCAWLQLQEVQEAKPALIDNRPFPSRRFSEGAERFYRYLLDNGGQFLSNDEVAAIAQVPIEEVPGILTELINPKLIKYWKWTAFAGKTWFNVGGNTTTKKTIKQQFRNAEELYTGVGTPCIEGYSTEYFEGVSIEPPARVHRLCFIYASYLPPTHTAFLREYAQDKPKDPNQWYTGKVPYCTYQVSKRGRLKLFLERDNDNITRGLESFANFMTDNGYGLNGLFEYSPLNSKGCWNAEYGFKASGEVRKYATTRVALQLVNSKVKVLVGFDKSLDDSWECDVKVYNAPSPQHAQRIAYRLAIPAALVETIDQIKIDIESIKKQLATISVSKPQKGDTDEGMAV